jgi:15-cis-phytoene synthase
MVLERTLSGTDSLQADWRRIEPLAELSELFLGPERHVRVAAWGLLLNEIEQAAMDLSEPRVAAVKLAWWADELQRAGQDSARHPLLRSLRPALEVAPLQATDWAALIAAAMELGSDEASVGSVEAQLSRYQRFTLPAARIEAALFGGEAADTARLHAVHLALEQRLLARRRQRQPWPLDLVARHGVSPAQAPAEAAAMPPSFAREHARILLAACTRAARPALYRAVASVARAQALRQLSRSAFCGPIAIRPGPLLAFSLWRAVRRAGRV